jgi:hypothetical protein
MSAALRRPLRGGFVVHHRPQRSRRVGRIIGECLLGRRHRRASAYPALTVGQPDTNIPVEVARWSEPRDSAVACATSPPRPKRADRRQDHRRNPIELRLDERVAPFRVECPRGWVRHHLRGGTDPPAPIPKEPRKAGPAKRRPASTCSRACGRLRALSQTAIPEIEPTMLRVFDRIENAPLARPAQQGAGAPRE